MTDTARQDLGWGRFLLQFASVVVVYLLAQFPAAAIWGYVDADGQANISSTGAAVSTAMGMAAALFVAWLWMRKDGTLGEAWNIGAPDSWVRTIGWAALATALIIGWFTVGSMMVNALGFATPDVSDVLDWATESQFHFILWIVLVALFSAGLGEELLWRGWLMDRLSRLGGLKGKVWLIILVQGLLFGLPHFYQGLGGVIIVSVVGFGFGWLRYRCGGNLWACILAHMAVDTLMLSLAYADRTGLMPGVAS